MRIHLMTRGLTDDYQFLGEVPADQRWSEFGRLTSFEHRSLLLRADADGWWLYLSAIPSARRDRSDTVIRYTVVLTGAAGEDADAVTALVREWLAESPALSAALDERFPAEVVERLLRSGDLAGEVGKRFAELLPELDDVDCGADPGGSWLGEAGSARARERLTQRVHTLLGGAEGWAAVLTLASEADAREWLAARSGGVHAVLLSERLRSEVVDVLPKARPAPERGRRSLVWVLCGATLLVAGLVLLIVWLVTRGSR